MQAHHRILSRVFPALLGATLPLTAAAAPEWWLTDPDRSALFQKQATPLTFSAGTNVNPIIQVDDTQTYQTIW
jgi:glucosylceramidase